MSKIETVELKDRGFSYIPGPSQYSAGVGALPGFTLERVRFANPVPLREGFERIAAYLKANGHPLTAFCACELRSPAPFTEQGFKDFNAIYTGVLSSWGVVIDGKNPVARSNVCPAVNPPAEPSFYAFTYAVPSADAAPSYLIAGSAEAPEGLADYRNGIVKLGDTSEAALREKAAFVLDEMERRMGAFSGKWSDATAAQIYTVHNIFPFIESELGKRGLLRHGLTWHFNRPPVLDLEYEMDCRRINCERVIEA